MMEEWDNESEVTTTDPIRLDDRTQAPERFGADFLTELRRILIQYVKPFTRNFIEWGSGHTTATIIGMREQLGLEAFFSMEHNRDYLAKVVAQLPAWSGFHPVYCDLRGPKRNDRDPEYNYSTWPLSLGRRFDFILIDGRRRLECAFVASLMSHQETIVALHDYRRTRYQPVTALFDIVEDGPQFRVLRPKRPKA